MSIKELKDLAFCLRKKTLKAFVENKEAHLGGSFSIIEILVALYYSKLDKKDKFILSKGHASYPMNIILNDLGFNVPMKTHLELDQENGIHATTGSLGHGLPIAAGIAFAKNLKNENGNIYVLISDGECQEGTTWETLLIVESLNLKNLTIIIDYNGIQALEKLKTLKSIESLVKKILSFDLECITINNGHCIEEIITKLNFKSNGPRVILANTIKGKGIKSIENDPKWHAKRIKPEMENQLLKDIYRV